MMTSPASRYFFAQTHTYAQPTPRTARLVWLIVPVVTCILRLVWPGDSLEASNMLTPSITLFGGSFAAAIWAMQRSISARSNPKYATSSAALNLLDDIVALTMWATTVAMTAVLSTFVGLFFAPAGALAFGLVLYELVLWLHLLVMLQRTQFELR